MQIVGFELGGWIILMREVEAGRCFMKEVEGWRPGGRRLVEVGSRPTSVSGGICPAPAVKPWSCNLAKATGP